MGFIFRPTWTKRRPDGSRVRGMGRYWWGEVVDPVTGRPIRRSLKTTDRREAERLLRQWEQAIHEQAADLEDLPSQSRREVPIIFLERWDLREETPSASLEELAERYLEHLKQAERSQRHIEQVRRVLTAFMRDTGARTLEHLDERTVQSWLSRPKGRRPFSVSTRNAYLGILKAWANWMVRDDILDASPLARLRPLRPDGGRDRRRRRILTRQEIVRLIEAARSDTRETVLSGQDRAAIYVCMLTLGLRIDEVLDLRVGDFSPRGEPKFLCWPRGSRSRPLPLPRSLSRELAPRLVDRLEQEPVFPPCSPRHFRRLFDEDRRKAGIGSEDKRGCVVDLDSLRYSLVAPRILKCVPRRFAEEMLRHVSIPVDDVLYEQLGLQEPVLEIDFTHG